MFREHHEADSFAIRGYAPDADPMNELPPNAGAKRPLTGPFRAFSYPCLPFPGGLETEAGSKEGGTDRENDA